MKNNSIVLLNLVELPKIVPVSTFKDGDIKDALSKTLNVDVENIVQITTGNPAIYGIKETYPKLKSKLQGVSPYYSEYPAKHSHYVRVLNAVW